MVTVNPTLTTDPDDFGFDSLANLKPEQIDERASQLLDSIMDRLKNEIYRDAVKVMEIREQAIIVRIRQREQKH